MPPDPLGSVTNREVGEEGGGGGGGRVSKQCQTHSNKIRFISYIPV